MGRGAISSCLVLVVAGGLGACTDLPPIPSGVCGNAVVERASGEDCDLFAVSAGSRCAAPSEPNQCRYVCGPASGSVPSACPSGMACGTDGVCRTGSGAFLDTGVHIAGTPRELFAGDIDGDGRTDLLEDTDNGVLVHYFDQEAVPEALLEMRSQLDDGEAPAIGDLTGDAIDDVALPTELGVVVMIGTKDRTLRPVAHPSITVPGVEQIHLTIAQADPSTVGRETLALGTINGVSALVTVPTNGVVEVLALMPGSPSQLAGPITMGNFDDRPTSPCDEAILSYRDDTPLIGPSMVLYPLCAEDAGGKSVLNRTGTLTVLDVAGAHIRFGAKAFDLDRDGHLDVVFGVEQAGKQELRVAYGIGDGTFGATPPNGSLTPGDNRSGLYGSLDHGAILSLGFLDGDGVVDYVTANEIRVSRGGAFGSVRAAYSASPLLEAVIADVNANGAADVLAASAAPKVHVYTGTGSGQFALFDVPAQAPVASLTPADFDGDGILDVALAERLGLASPGVTADSISILFGRPFAVPEPPVSVGRLDTIVQIIGDQGTDTNGVIDSTTEFTTSSLLPDGRYAFSGFQGRSDRALRAPYVTAVTLQRDPLLPPSLVGFFPFRLALGDLTGDGRLDLVEVSSGRQDNVSLGPRLWLTPCTDEARLLQSEHTPSDKLTDTVLWNRSFETTLDLDGDGKDEVAALAPLAGDPSKGVAIIARVVANADGTTAWQMTESPPMDFVFGRIEELDRPMGETRGAALRKADFDGDGRVDIAVLSGSPGTDGGGSSSVVVFWNDGRGVLSRPVVVPNPDGAPPVSFSVVRADADEAPEIALLSDGAVYLVDWDAARQAFFVARDAVVSLPGATLVHAGDFSGDGVDDLVLGGGGQLAVFRGVPTTR